MLMRRDKMSPEQAAEAAVPFIYDPTTPRERIDEDLAIRAPWLPTPEGYAAQLQGILGWEAYSRLGQIVAPTLVIHGETDRLVPPANAKLIAERIPGAKLIMIPHAGHLFLTDQTEVAHGAILDFLVAQSARMAADNDRARGKAQGHGDSLSRNASEQEKASC
jgi:pimeloyl-ACP methyl ester carboxylesterase